MPYDMTKDEMESYLKAGTYWCRITDYETCESGKGSTGVNVTFWSHHPRGIAKQKYWLNDAEGKPSKARWRLAELLVKSGMKEADRREFELPMLKGLHVGIEWALQDLDSIYHEVKTHLSLEDYAHLTGTVDTLDKPPAYTSTKTESGTVVREPAQPESDLPGPDQFAPRPQSVIDAEAGKAPAPGDPEYPPVETQGVPRRSRAKKSDPVKANPEAGGSHDRPF